MHILAVLALSAMVWGSKPEEPEYTTVSVVYGAPADQQTSDEQAGIGQKTATEQQAAADQQAAVEQQEPADQQAQTQQPPPAEPPPAPAEPLTDTASKTEPVTTEPSQPTPLADAVPVMPIPNPAPADPVPPNLARADLAPVPPPPVPPPPVVVEAPPPPPAPLPPPKPPPKQIAARPPIAKPTLSHAPPPPAGRPASGPETQAGAATPQAAQPDASVLSSWNTLFSAWLAARKTYPEIARRRGEQGSVTLRFTVAGDGAVVEVALVAGSGSHILDESALALLRNAKLPRPQAEITRTVHVRYRLED